MSYDLTLQRFASRCATVLIIPSWVGFLHCYFHRAPSVTVSGMHVAVPEFGIIPVATLLCSLLAFMCSLPAVSDEPDRFSSWLLSIACAIPFFGTISLLDPMGASPIGL